MLKQTTPFTSTEQNCVWRVCVCPSLQVWWRPGCLSAWQSGPTLAWRMAACRYGICLSTEGVSPHHPVTTFTSLHTSSTYPPPAHKVPCWSRKCCRGALVSFLSAGGGSWLRVIQNLKVPDIEKGKNREVCWQYLSGDLDSSHHKYSCFTGTWVALWSRLGSLEFTFDQQCNEHCYRCTIFYWSLSFEGASTIGHERPLQAKVRVQKVQVDACCHTFISLLPEPPILCRCSILSCGTFYVFNCIHFNSSGLKQLNGTTDVAQNGNSNKICKSCTSNSQKM